MKTGYFLIRKKIKRNWDGGFSVEFCGGSDPLDYWQNRKAAKVFSEAEIEAVESLISANAKQWPPAADEEVTYDLIPLTDTQAEKQKQNSIKAQFIEGKSSRWLKTK